MQRLEVSCAVRRLCKSLGVKGLTIQNIHTAVLLIICSKQPPWWWPHGVETSSCMNVLLSRVQWSLFIVHFIVYHNGMFNFKIKTGNAAPFYRTTTWPGS